MPVKIFSPGPIQIATAYSVLAVLCLIFLNIAWTGFVSSDDAYYVESGLAWLNQFPYVPQHFGNVRAVVSIPIAISVLIFGESEFSVVASTSFFYIATVALTFEMLRKEAGLIPAFLTSLLLSSVPLFALKATIPCADIPELFFVASSFWVFWHGCTNNKPATFIISGVLAGLAFSAHELTAALLLFYGILFLLGFRVSRRNYLYIAAGFVLVIAVEALYYWVTAGNPAHRFMLLMQATSVNDRVHVAVFQIAAGGTIHLWAPIDPLIMFFTHHDMGLIGWASIPSAYWVYRQKGTQDARIQILARLLLGLALAWFITSAILLRHMILLPRYYMVTVYCLLVVTGLWCANLINQKRTLFLGAFVASVCLANLVCVLLDNKNPRFAERALVNYLAETKDAIHTDPLTAHNAMWFCRWAKVDCDRILPTPPNIGNSYFWNPRNTTGPNRFITLDQLPSYQPRSSWTKERTIVEAPRIGVNIATAPGVFSLLPPQLSAKLSARNVVEIYLRQD